MYLCVSYGLEDVVLTYFLQCENWVFVSYLELIIDYFVFQTFI